MHVTGDVDAALRKLRPAVSDEEVRSLAPCGRADMTIVEPREPGLQGETFATRVSRLAREAIGHLRDGPM